MRRTGRNLSRKHCSFIADLALQDQHEDAIDEEAVQNARRDVYERDAGGSLPASSLGSGAWDPGRGVEIFQKRSEVLARFLKMGTWEEEEKPEGSPSQSPA